MTFAVNSSGNVHKNQIANMTVQCELEQFQKCNYKSINRLFAFEVCKFYIFSHFY